MSEPIVETKNWMRGVPGGEASLDPSTGRIPLQQLGSGTPTNTKFLRGDGTWALPPSGGGGSLPPEIEAATQGTAGSPGEENRFVTDVDARMTNARVPVAHTHSQDEVDDLLSDLASLASSISAKAASDDPRFTDARTPVAHVHPVSDVTGLQAALDAKAASSHSHPVSEVTGLQTALDSKAASSHTHPISDVTNLQTTLNGKAASVHTHPISEVTGLQAALDSKQNVGGGGSAVQHSIILTPPGQAWANNTAVTALTSGLTMFLYLGRLASAAASLQLIVNVTTAAATITWAEVAVFKGSVVANGNASLTRLGHTDVAAVFNSTGRKVVTVNLTGAAAGDDIWIALGSQATTPFQVRGSLAEDLQIGVVQTASVRPSLAASPQAVTLGGAALVPARIAVKLP